MKKTLLTLAAVIAVIAFIGNCVAPVLHAQTLPGAPTTPPLPTANTVIGAVDAWHGGWAADRTDPEQSITVALVMETGGSMRLLTYVWANGPRPDVNKNVGIPGDHGFGIGIDEVNQICDGNQHIMHYFGLAVESGKPVELPVSSPNANKITCGTKAGAITGTVKNRFGKAVTTESWNASGVVLLKLDDRGIAQNFAYSSVDADGKFSITQGMGGENLLDGTYELWVLARGYLNNIPSHRRFTYTRTTALGFTFMIDKAPVYIEVNGEAPAIPSSGQYLSVPLRVCNLDFTPGSMGFLTELHINTSGPGKSSLYNVTPDQTWYVSVPPDPGTCYTTSLSLSIDPTLPDGQYYCASVKATATGDPDDGWSETGTCAPKGAKENLGSLRPKG